MNFFEIVKQPIIFSSLHYLELFDPSYIKENGTLFKYIIAYFWKRIQFWTNANLFLCSICIGRW